MNIFDIVEGHDPILLSFPHSGTFVPSAIAQRMTKTALRLEDTDWHVPALYQHLIDQGANALIANYSRYVIDLNRPPTNESLYPGQNTTGLVPDKTFSEDYIYEHGMEPKRDEIDERIEKYWRPYHQALRDMIDELVESFGYAILIDCHSIPRSVPYLFEGELPDFNIGMDTGRTAPSDLAEGLRCTLDASPFSYAMDGRFKGGYITREYAIPEKYIYTFQIELVQETYLDRRPLAEPEIRSERTELTTTLSNIYNAALSYLDRV